MIDPTQDTVVSRASQLMSEALQRIDNDINPYLRMLTPSDPNYSIGVFPSVWMPDEDSYEIRGSLVDEPTLQTYQIGVHVLTKDSDRVRGLSMHTVLAKRVRSVLYRDTLLRVGLQSLTVSDSLGTESFGRGRLVSHRYLSNEIGKNQLAYLSVLDYSLETEMR